MKEPPRIWRIGQSRYYGDEATLSLDTHTEARLQAVREAGFNGVWIGARLYDLIPLPGASREQIERASERRAILRRLIRRCQKHELGLWLYFNEPRGLPVDSDFWNRFPDWRGVEHLDAIENRQVAALCLGNEDAARWFERAVRRLLSGLRGLSGVILITASEHHTHCWSHHFSASPVDCPRCAPIGAARTVERLARAWCETASALSPSPRVLVWNWSWAWWKPNPEEKILSLLPKNAEPLLDWERGGVLKSPLGNLPVDEYSLGFTGPSPRFLRSYRTAQSRGLTVHAKLQLGNTHELATVPNLPLLFNLCRKLDRIAELPGAGFMGTWLIGCEPSLNTALHAFHRQCRPAHYSVSDFLDAFARFYFEVDDGRASVAAWKQFGEAFRHYPFSIPFLYRSPLNWIPRLAPRQRYRAQPLPWNWLPTDAFGDRLSDCFGPLSLEEILERLRKLSTHWEKGLVHFESGPQPASQSGVTRWETELRIARATNLIFSLAANAFEFALERSRRPEWKGWERPSMLEDDALVRKYAHFHRELTRSLRLLARKDSRIGYHEEAAFYFYQ